MRKDRENALQLHMTPEDKEFLEMVDQEYYKRVKTSSEYYRRKKLILQNLEKLQKKVESSAKNYDDYAKLKFIMIEKAKQKKSVLKNFVKLENYQQTNSTDNRYYEEGSQHNNQQSNTHFDEDSQFGHDDFEQLYGVENEFTRELFEKIQASKQHKGRGLLLSFFEFN